jgi:hypothetical protein
MLTDQEKDKLWNEHCIQGNEHNPTDTMYYEGFMDAIDKAYQTGIKDGREEILNELNEEQRKFAEGFAYKPKE